MPPDRLRALPGYDPDVQKNRGEAREIMQRLGYGPDNPLAVKVAARNIPLYRDPAVMLIDQLKEIYHCRRTRHRRDRQLEPEGHAPGLHGRARKHRQCSRRRPRSAILRKLCLRVRTAISLDIAIVGSRISSTGSRARPTRKGARQLVWDIDATLQQEEARPVIFHTRGATCWHPQVKGLTTMVNSMYNGWRMEDVWLDRQ